MTLVAGEVRRVVAGRTLPTFLAAGAGVGLLLTGGLILLGPEHMNPPMPGADTVPGVRGFLSLLVLTAPIAIMLGARSVTREYDTRTVVPTFLTEPRRARLILAKLVANVAAGALYGILLAAGASAGILGGCKILGIAPGLPPAEVVTIALRVGAAMTLYTLIGVGIGALVPRPQACLAVVVGWFYLAESFVSTLPGVGGLYPWLPGGAASALAGHSFVVDALARTAGTGSVALLPAWAGAVVLVGYALLGCVSALILTTRRDIT